MTASPTTATPSTADAAAPEPFGARLARSLAERGPLCVGIDPHAALLGGWDLPDDPSGLERFTMTVVETLAPVTSVFKPQSAFFERHGSRGIAVLERAVAEARAAGALVLLDVKRTDMGSTMQGYAEAYLDPSAPMAVDAITATPFLGFETLRPMLTMAATHGTGLFVVTKTSNPEGPQFQEARCADGRTVVETLVAAATAENAGADPMGSVGLVIGATLDSHVPGLDALNGPILFPGVGTQGGRPGDMGRIVGTDAVHRVLPSVSRELLGAGPTPDGLRAAFDRLDAECHAALAP